MPLTTYTPGEVLTAASLNDNFSASYKIVQIVTGSTTTNVLNSTTSFVDTTLTATITPTSASNNILIVVTQQGCIKNAGNTQNGLDLRLVRGATSIQTFGDNFLFTNTLLAQVGAISTQFLDSPATTSATTYKTQLANNTAAVSVQVQGSNTQQSFITLYEVTP